MSVPKVRRPASEQDVMATAGVKRRQVSQMATGLGFDEGVLSCGGRIGTGSGSDAEPNQATDVWTRRPEGASACSTARRLGLALALYR
jgi:hypothetical protein